MNKAPNEMDIQVGRRIRTGRLAADMSQTELGNRLGVTFQQIQKYEKGANRVGAGRLQRIADALNVPITFFFADGTAPRGTNQESFTASLEFINTARAMRLVKAYSRIRDPQVQIAIVDLVERIANADE